MRTPTEDGFALVEAITALALAAIAAAGLMSALGSTAARSAEMDARSSALRQAQTLLVEVLAIDDLADLPRRGDLQSLSWIVGMAEDQPWPGIQEVHVDVTWSAAGKKGVTRLAGYRLAPPV